MRVLIAFALCCTAAGYALPEVYGVPAHSHSFLEKSAESPHPRAVPASHASQVSTPLLIYGCVLLFVASLVVAIFWKNGTATIAAVLLYIGALSTMTIQLRELFAVQMFNFPRFVTATHFLGAAVVTGIILAVEKHIGQPVTVINKPTFMRGVLPAAMCFTLSLGFANLGIAYTNAHFYEMVEGCTVLITTAIAFFMGRPTPLVLVSILMITVMGQSLCWTGEINFSMIGLILLLGSAVCRSTKGVLNQLLMSSDGSMQSLRPIELTFYNSITCLALMGPWAFASEGALPVHRLMNSGFGLFRALIVTVITACVIQVSGASVVRAIGAVAAQLTGSIKGFLSVLGAWAALGEIIATKQWIGYIIVLASIAGYNRLDAMLKERAAKMKAEFEYGSTNLDKKVGA